jgi:hypothetical protein
LVGVLEVEKTGTIDATPAMVRDDYKYLRKSKKTLLMFRRLSDHIAPENKLELRHQRTGDVVFDFHGIHHKTLILMLLDKMNPFIKP